MTRDGCNKPGLPEMRLFWHGSRGCPVPLTRAEVEAKLAPGQRQAMGEWLKEMMRAGLLLSDLATDWVKIYTPTPKGARISCAAYEVHHRVGHDRMQQVQS